jgi:toxin ParE1/3/4
MNVLWTLGARTRLKEIEAYIAKDSPQAAREMAIRLIRRSLSLEQPPLLGHRLMQYSTADVRELLERPYRLIYRVMTDRIEIITVMHYRQLLPSDLHDLDAARGG